MAENEPTWSGVSIELKPHAYDPVTMPELFEGVLPRRIVAFVIDFIIVAIPIVLAAVFILVFAVFTLGLGLILFWLLGPVAVIWALCYVGFTIGSDASATLGMRVMDLQMRTWYGAPAYALLGAVHTVIFWLTVSTLTPFVLLVALLNQRHRTLHDILVGTIVINNPARAAVLRRHPAGV